MAERLALKAPRNTQVYFSFEDERLFPLDVKHLNWVLEEYYLLFPEMRDAHKVTFYFDEIQLVPGWETFVRRILDTEFVEVFVSGSSAKMLSREVASALRGRGTETVIFPFSFREFLRHRGREIEDVARLTKAQRSWVERAFTEYLVCGGFPEAQGLAKIDAIPLLQGYVETVVFRDVIERYQLTNIVALKRMVRQIIASPGARFSVHRLLADLRSQGVPVGKETLHAMFEHLVDAFLIRSAPIYTASERRRQSNPRKIYPVDPGLIGAFDRSGRANLGHALETTVLIELERRGYSLSYYLSPKGTEVDFIAESVNGSPILIQVCADLSDEETQKREFRSIAAARAEMKNIPSLLLAKSALDVALIDPPRGVKVRSVWEWMLSARV